MADYELIEERLISGKGVLKIPQDKNKYRHNVLYLDVIRDPRNKYLNKNWNPARSKFAYLTFLRDDYIISTGTMEFDRQSFDTVSDVAGQTLIAVKCAYEGILISFANLAIAQGLFLTQYDDLIKDYENLRLGWEEVRISCYADTAIQARLYRLVFDSCDPTKDKQKKPPPPPPPLPKVPPGTAIGDLSPPYDGENDDGNTEPYPGDDIPEPPPPACTKLAVQIRYKVGGQTVNTTRGLYAPLGGFTIGTYQAGGLTNWGLSIQCRGDAGGQCQPNPVQVAIDAAIVEISDPEIISYTVVP